MLTGLIGLSRECEREAAERVIGKSVTPLKWKRLWSHERIFFK
jgi:hypothetical protein